jgi:hypothetical protein
LPADYENILSEAKKNIKPKSICMNPVGSNKLNIEVFADKVRTKYGDIRIDVIEKLVEAFTLFNVTIPIFVENSEAIIGNYPAVVVSVSELGNSRVILIGCRDENNLFSLNELKTLIECSKKLK